MESACSSFVAVRVRSVGRMAADRCDCRALLCTSPVTANTAGTSHEMLISESWTFVPSVCFYLHGMFDLNTKWQGGIATNFVNTLCGGIRKQTFRKTRVAFWIDFKVVCVMWYLWNVKKRKRNVFPMHARNKQIKNKEALAITIFMLKVHVQHIGEHCPMFNQLAYVMWYMIFTNCKYFAWQK